MARLRDLWCVFAAVAAIAAAPTFGRAATVTWSGLQSITSSNDIVNAGSVVAAINFGNNGDIGVTVGGDSFTFLEDTEGGIGYIGDGSKFDATGTSVAADFDSVLDSFAFFNGAGSTTRSFSGLTAGGTYTVQTFASDDPSNSWSGMIFTIDGVASAPHTQVGTDPNSSGFSPFATATVVLGAGETSFDLVISSTGTSVVNAVVVAEQVPEPVYLTIVGIISLSLGGLFVRRRNRSA